MLREELYIKYLCLNIDNSIINHLGISHFIWKAKYCVGEFQYVVSPACNSYLVKAVEKTVYFSSHSWTTQSRPGVFEMIFCFVD